MTYVVIFEYHDASATLVVWDDEKRATLSTVIAKFRKQGTGTAVIKKALAYADVFGMEVLLEVQPFGDEPRMPETELKAWYRTFGFYPTGGNTMRRLSIPKEGENASSGESTDAGDGK